jgi:ABC-type transport system involved in multi-copper enzyme maturation permease subunit
MVRKAISPAMWFVSILFSPILQRELRASGRRKSTYIIRCGYAALFAFGALLAISTIMSGMEFESSTMRSQSLSKLAESMVLFVVWFQIIAIVLLAPIMTSPSICEEKQRGTLGALMTTPLTAAQIVVGKMTGRMYQVLLLALIGAPLLLAIRVFGGVPSEWIFAFTSVTLSAAVLAGSLGIMFAMWHDRSGPAAIFALLTLGLMFATPPLVMFAIQQTGFDTIESRLGVSQEQFLKLMPYGVASCPPIALAMLITDGPISFSIPFLSGTPFDRIWLLSVLYMLAVSVLVLWISSRSMRKLLLQSSGAAPATEQNENKSIAKLRSTNRLVGLKSRPIYWREAHRAWLPNIFQRVVLGVVLVSLLGFAYYKTDLSETPMHMLIGFSGLCVLLLCSAVMTTSSINGERVADTWDALMTSPVSGKDVILGKYFAVIRRLAPIAAYIVVHFVVMAAMGHLSWGASAMAISLIVTPPMFYLATGIVFSLFFKKGVTSSVSNIVLLLMLLFVIPIIIAITFETLLPRGGMSGQAEKIIMGSHPAMMLGTVIYDDIDGRWHNASRGFSLGNDSVSMATMLKVTFAQGLAHLGLAAGVLYFGIRRFCSASGRSS